MATYRLHKDVDRAFITGTLVADTDTDFPHGLQGVPLGALPVLVGATPVGTIWVVDKDEKNVTLRCSDGGDFYCEVISQGPHMKLVD